MDIKQNDEVCGCGSVGDAIRVAEQLFIDTHSMNCPSWTFQVAVALRTICVRSLVVETGLNVKQIAEFAKDLSTATTKHMTAPEELLRRSHEKRET